MLTDTASLASAELTAKIQSCCLVDSQPKSGASGARSRRGLTIPFNSIGDDALFFRIGPLRPLPVADGVFLLSWSAPNRGPRMLSAENLPGVADKWCQLKGRVEWIETVLFISMTRTSAPRQPHQSAGQWNSSDAYCHKDTRK